MKLPVLYHSCPSKKVKYRQVNLIHPEPSTSAFTLSELINCSSLETKQGGETTLTTCIQNTTTI